jgi:hypothetical protein
VSEKRCNAIGIAIFERQLIRSLLQSDDGQILKLLASTKRRLIIFTNSENASLIDRSVKAAKVGNFEIVEFCPPSLGLLPRILQFFLRWVEPSTGTQRMAHREFSEGRISGFGLGIRLLLWYFFGKSIRFKCFLRTVFNWLYPMFNPERSRAYLPDLQLLILTSITNLEDEIHLGFMYRKLGCFVVGSTRSWDNLTTKGVFPFEPDLFLANSQYIFDCAVKSQGFNPSRIVLLPSSYYRSDLLPTFPTKTSQKVAYACMGPALNKDEVNLIFSLNKLSHNLGISITIIQHPQFKHELSEADYPWLKFISFNYNETNLGNFYRGLSSYSLVIGSGTSLLLDAAFVGVPVAATRFEIEEQPYWTSHLRNFDKLPHTREFFKSSDIRKLNSLKELETFLREFRDTGYRKVVNKSYLKYFIGEWEQIFSIVLFEQLSATKTLSSIFLDK